MTVDGQVEAGETKPAGGDSGRSGEDAIDNPGEDTAMYTGGDIDAREVACGGGRPSNIDPSKMQEGRGDPTSSMLWSPQRIAGQKRSLATREEAGHESEAESGEFRLGEEDESEEEEDEEGWEL